MLIEDCLGDLLVKMHQTTWDFHPDRPDLGEQTFLASATAWDTAIMVSSSRRMFNLTKSGVWARMAAWSEWVNVCPALFPFPLFYISPCYLQT